VKFVGTTIALLLLSACSTQPHAVSSSDIAVPPVTRVYVVKHGWHTGFVVPAQVIQSRLPELVSRYGDTRYIEFGWGDRAYYQSAGKSLGLTLRAVLWPTDTIVYTRSVPLEPGVYFEDAVVESLCLDSTQYARLVQFIENSFYRDESGSLVFSQDGPVENSFFYKGTGDYYLFNTCNTWTARGLKSAGFDISPAFKIQAGSVMRSLSSNQPGMTIACAAPETDTEAVL
jgi:uncharacterized protein (TIGR02117 family)